MEDFGLKATDQDAHCPAFFVIRKSEELQHKDLHLRSAAGKRKDKEKSARKKKAKKQRMQAQGASSSSAAPAPSAAPYLNPYIDASAPHSSDSDPEDLEEVEV